MTLAKGKSANQLRSRKKSTVSSKEENGIATTNFDELRFNLANELQSTLDLELTLRSFFNSVNTIVNCGGLRYLSNDKKISIQFGSQDGHSAGYSVSSKIDQLGDLVFFRKHPFAEAELAALEMLIGVLFFPLRNALKYRAALASSYTDMLTGLGNRQSLEIASFREVRLAQRHSRALSLLVIDIDHFKSVNDLHGHLSGDAVLGHIAKVIKETLRDSDQVFRFGGEEFVALLTETAMEQAKLTGERIRSAIEATSIANGESNIRVTTSVGVASLTGDDDFKALFQRADAALYQAKSCGRNQVCYQKLGTEIKKIA